MCIRQWNMRGCLAAFLAGLAISTVAAQVPAGQGQQGPEAPLATSQLQPGNPNEHPLMPALRWARQGLPGIERIQDYTATLIKQERIGATLGEDQYISLRVRHQPFSVYLGFLKPNSLRGQECMYIDGANNGKMWRTAPACRRPSARSRFRRIATWPCAGSAIR